MNYGTLLLYLFIMLSTTYLASRAQIVRRDGRVLFCMKYFMTAFLIHWFFISFTRIGTDHESYIAILEFDAYRRISIGQELGFNGLCILLQQLTKNAEVGLFIIKTLTLALFYVAFYLMKDRAHLGFVIGAYNAWQYFFCFCIIAHALAIAIVVLAGVLVMRDSKWYWPLLLTLVAFTVHASALVMFVVMLGAVFLNKIHFKLNFILVIIILIGAFVAINNIQVIFNMITADVVGFDQYANKDISGNAGSGWFNYALFLFIFIMFIMPVIQSNFSANERNAIIVFYTFSFISAIMGYYLGTARLNQYAFVLYGISIPWYFYHVENKICKANSFVDIKLQRVLWILYLVFVTYGAIRNAMDPMGTRMMSNYQLFNPFTWDGRY